MSKESPKPRLCHLVKWPDFDGYGFNLHAEKTKSGQFIGQVDEDSPAESAGLRQGDRIVEVNGVNIANENHKQVVERIKAIPNETKLLVLDEEADKYYKSKKILVKNTLPAVQRLKTAIPRPRRNNRPSPPASESAPTPVLPAAADNDGDRTPHSVNGGGNGGHPTTTASDKSSSNGKINGSDESENDERRSQNSFNLETSEKILTFDDKLSDSGSRRSSNRSTPSGGWKDDSRSSSSSATARESPRPLTPPLTPVDSTTTTTRSSDTASNGTATGGGGTGTGQQNGLNLNMSVQQMRAMLANRKKYDPKKEAMDLRKKHAIIQQM